MTPTHIKHGIYGGLAGGVVFGAMMGMMGMLSMIGNMLGIPTAWGGFVVHMLISAFIGGTFALLVHWTGWRAGVGTGLAYGSLWWVLGPLTLMPLMMGMELGVNWNIGAIMQAMPSLMGHLVFGGILGWAYARLASHASPRHEQEQHAQAA